jgi:hypothetical protein
MGEAMLKAVTEVSQLFEELTDTELGRIDTLNLPERFINLDTILQDKIATEIVDTVITNRNEDFIKKLSICFRLLPYRAKSTVESHMIELMQDKLSDEVTRIIIINLLAQIVSPTVAEALIAQLKIESSSFVRLQLCKSLLESFANLPGTVPIVVTYWETELVTHNRVQIGRHLALHGGLAAVPTLTSFFKPDIDTGGILQKEDWDNLRIYAARSLANHRAKHSVEEMVQLLLHEELQYSASVKSVPVQVAIINALVEIADNSVLSRFSQLFQQTDNQQVQLRLLHAFDSLTTPDDKEIVTLLLDATCHPDRVTAIAATDVVLRLLKTDAAQYLVNFGLQQTDPERVARIADALRLIRGGEAIEALQGAQDNPEKAHTAQSLLEQIGGRSALNVLVDRRMATINHAQDRVKEFDKQALQLFEDTIREAKRGFVISMGMSVAIFVVGVLLIIVSIYLMLFNEESFTRLLGAGSGLTGLGTILVMFYNGPLERVERAVANLVQTEIAFLGYIRQVTQITAMFEREYLDSDRFGLQQLQLLLNYTEHTMKETMPLVNQYTAVRIENSQKSPMSE